MRSPLAVVLSLSVWAGCGARSGLSDELDAGSATASRDAARPDATRRDAGVTMGVDAGEEGLCPPPPVLGFRFVSRAIELGATPTSVSLAMIDGEVFVASEEDVGADEPHVVVRRVDTLGDAEPAVIADLGVGEVPVIGAHDGMLAVAYATRRSFLHVDVLRGDGTIEWTIRDVPSDGVHRVGRPVHNGETWLVGFVGRYGNLGAVDRDGYTGVVRFGPVDERFGAAVDPESGDTHLLYRFVGESALLLVSVDREGRILGPTGGRPIGGFGWESVPALGWTTSLGAWPLVLGGFSSDEGETRMRAHRYELDGLPGPGFSSPAATSEHRWALSTLAPARHASGYGLVGAERGEGGWELRFHGAGEDFVGDSQPIGRGAPSETFDIDITTNACGYLIAWIDGGTALQTVTAIAR